MEGHGIPNDVVDGHESLTKIKGHGIQMEGHGIQKKKLDEKRADEKRFKDMRCNQQEQKEQKEQKEQDDGFNLVVANADIFFDETLRVVQNKRVHADLQRARKMFALARWELTNNNTHGVGVAGKTSSRLLCRFDSQDTWIVHSSQLARLWTRVPGLREAFRFPLGLPGCDNKLLYLFKVLGFTVYNTPARVRSFHNHESNVRDYFCRSNPQGTREKMKPPYFFSVPLGPPAYSILPSFGMHASMAMCAKEPGSVSGFEDNERLFAWLRDKARTAEAFYIPQLHAYPHSFSASAQEQAQEQALLAEATICSVFRAPRDQDLARETRFERQRNQDRTKEACLFFWGGAYEIYHYALRERPWVHALRGKRLLLV